MPRPSRKKKRKVSEEDEELLGLKDRPKPPPDSRMPARTPEQKLLDLGKIAALVRRGYSQTAVADALGMSVNQVQLDWRLLVQQTRVAQKEDVKAKISLMLEQLSEIKMEAWKSWELSKNPLQRRTTRGRAGYVDEEGNPIVETTDVEEGQTGDPRFLRVVMDAMAKEAELQGLYPEKKVSVTGTMTWDILMGALKGPVEDMDRDWVEDEIQKHLAEGGVHTQRLSNPNPDQQLMEVIDHDPL